MNYQKFNLGLVHGFPIGSLNLHYQFIYRTTLYGNLIALDVFQIGTGFKNVCWIYFQPSKRSGFNEI